MGESRMNKKAAIMDGKIKCSVYGEMSGTDCGCMQEEKICGGCYIFDAMKNVSADLAGELLEKVSTTEH